MRKKIVNIDGVFEILKIKPKSKKIYYQALTHKTYVNENKDSESYEKLEFVGDSILQHYTSLYIYKKFSNEISEGEMSIIRSKFVSTSTLSKIVKHLGLNNYLICSNNVNELRENEKICSDIFESLLAAVYLDLGEQVTIDLLSKNFFNLISNNINKIELKDPKTHLQELLQPIFKKSIQYECEQIENKNWKAKAICQNNIYGTGIGKTKKEAEIAAAKDALSKLKIN